MNASSAGKVISTILRHDDKQTSYKIALIRSINDVVLNFPDVDSAGQDVAVPLHTLADLWIAYYWPFVEPYRPIYQGPRAVLNEELRNDMAFRPALTALRAEWERIHGRSRPSDGFFLISELRIERKRAALPDRLLELHRKARRSVAKTLRMPIRYAGPGNWSVFSKPVQYRKVALYATALPGKNSNRACLLISPDLWTSFRQLSLWVEALCIHEWCLFSESVKQEEDPVDRGDVYRILTDRPDNRIALTWERNRIDVLLMEGHTFICPWTETAIRNGTAYDLDHLLPLSVYPINELWNLVPADPHFNAHGKRARLPSLERLQKARSHLSLAYKHHLQSAELERALHRDVAMRFLNLDHGDSFPDTLSSAATRFIGQVAESRNLARF